jgi:hypothetical protein
MRLEKVVFRSHPSSEWLLLIKLFQFDGEEKKAFGNWVECGIIPRENSPGFPISIYKSVVYSRTAMKRSVCGSATNNSTMKTANNCDDIASKKKFCHSLAAHSINSIKSEKSAEEFTTF